MSLSTLAGRCFNLIFEFMGPFQEQRPAVWCTNELHHQCKIRWLLKEVCLIISLNQYSFFLSITQSEMEPYIWFMHRYIDSFHHMTNGFVCEILNLENEAADDIVQFVLGPLDRLAGVCVCWTPNPSPTPPIHRCN